MLARLMAISAARSGGANWERMWAGGLAPGEAFDAAQPELALQALIPGSGITGLSPSTQGSLQLHGKRVLVPGCGRGYAVEALARGGAAAVTGLEVAPTAVQRANEYLEHATAGTDFSNSWSVVEGDFFALETESGGKAHAGYDVVYDCTFLCAIPPALRESWASTMAGILKPGGQLVVLIFPVRTDIENERVDPGDELLQNPGSGPPFSMSPLLVKRLLLPLGFALETMEKVPDALLTRRFAGEYIARFKRAT